MKPITLIFLFQTVALSLGLAFQITEVPNYYLTQGVLGASTLVLGLVAVHQYRENKNLTAKIISILGTSLQQQNDMTRAIEDLTKSLDIKNAIKEAIRER